MSSSDNGTAPAQELSQRIQGLVDTLSTNSADDGSEQVLDDIVQLIDKFPSQPTPPGASKPFQDSYNSAIALWNLAVTLKTSSNSDDATDTIVPQMRLAACRLVSLCTLALPATSAAFSKVAQMATKTGRSWLESDNPSMAEASIALAAEFHRKHGDSLSLEQESKGEYATSSQWAEHGLQGVRIDLYEVEVASVLGQHQRAIDKFEDMKSSLPRYPKQAQMATMLAYNLGVTCFKQFNFPAAATWLSESYDVGKQCVIGAMKQARTLRLLARCYLETGDDSELRKALNAVDLANTEHMHPSGLYCKLSVLLKLKSSENAIRQALFEYVSHVDVSIDMAMVAIKDLVKNECSALAVNGLDQLATRFQNTPNENRIHIEELELLIELERVEDACRVVERCLSGHSEYQPISAGDRQYLHNVLWKHAARDYEASKYKPALLWYDYSADFFSASELETKNACKLQRNRCLCLIGLGRFTEAALALQQSRQYEPDNPFTHFLLYKIAILQGEDQNAIDELRSMVQVGSKATKEAVSDQDIHGLISLAAQLAFEKSNRGVAMHALEGLIQYSTDNNQILVALRCLVRLRCTFLSENSMSDLSSLVFYIRKALEKLQAMTAKEEEDTAQVDTEVTWFMKMAWNVTLQCVDAVEELHSLFMLCYKFTLLLPNDNALLNRQKTCLLMAAASSLQLARDSSTGDSRDAHLLSTLDHIKDCHGICSLLAKRQLARNQSSDMARILILLYEFECKAKLRHGDLQTTLDSLADMDVPDGSTFETVAAIAVDAPGNNRQVAMNALRLSLKKYLERKPPDVVKYSKAVHSLVQLALEVSSSESRDEAMLIFSGINDILSSPNKTLYPEMEIVWLMTKSWNTGIQLFSAMNYCEAEKWCSFGLNLLSSLSTMKNSYESQMSTAYAEVLSKCEAFNATRNHEE